MKNPPTCGKWLGVVLALASCLAAQTHPDTAAQFTSEVQPILRANCLPCHNDKSLVSGLSLETRESILRGGNRGADPKLILNAVRQTGDLKMPPAGKLQDAQIAAMATWIEQGLPMPDSLLKAKRRGADHWAFQPPKKMPPPAVRDAAWVRNPIDAFILARLEAAQLAPSPEADRATLLRRVSLDLTGLPPSPQEVAEFVADKRGDAYERVVDRLLASPHYGERWGRNWLDVARYADSSGFEFDITVENGWRYRDYVIKAFNEDKPYNQFIIEQLAGDELDHPTYDSLTATTFYRVGPRVRFREKNYPSYRYDYMDDMVRTTFQGFMGLSVNCARCHDHKFDPITRMDYYRSVAAFWGYVDYDQPLAPPEKVAEYERIKKELEAEITPLKQEIARIEKPYREKQREQQIQDALKKFPEDIQVAIKTPEEKRTR